MGSISGVNQVSMDYGRIAGGKRIHSAADDAAGLAIANKLQKENRGLDAGASNIRDGISAANVKDGALGGIQSSLQRIYELSVKASNGLYGSSEKQSIQDEIDQLLQDIQSAASGTTFNEQKLLDGSMADMNIASNPDGTGMKLQMQNTTLSALGLEGYNVTGDFDISVIENAMNKISSARSSNGASTNALEYAYGYNTNASLQTLSAQSRIEDLDIPEAVSEQKKKELIQNYQHMMQKKQAEDQAGILKLFQ